MLSSLSPVGEHARGQRWGLTAASYLVGSALGGAAVGGTLGLVGGALLGATSPVTRAVALAVVTALSWALARAGRLPSWHRQVDERWLTTYRGWVYGGGFGLQLGAAFLTIVATWWTYAAFAAALLAGDAASGLAIGTTFGIVRALPLLSTRRVTTPTALRDLMARLAAHQPAP